MNETKRTFWDERAQLNETAGTNDFMLKNMEKELLLRRVKPGASVLDIGCGNGSTLIALAGQLGCTGLGLDFSESMLDLARAATEAGLDKILAFRHCGVQNLPQDLGLFDCAITERCLINLDSEAEQHTAFSSIMLHLRPGGRYFMIEGSIDGFHRLNEQRALFGLEPIGPPWHNLLFNEEAVRGWASAECVLEEIDSFASTYYLLSRVVYARLAQDSGEPLRYDSPINTIACKLPAHGDYGPTRLWVWRRA